MWAAVNGDGDRLELAVRAVEIGIRGQAESLGTSMPERVPTPNHETPSAAVEDIAEFYDLALTPEQRATLAELDDLEDPLRSALTDTIDAYLALAEATPATHEDEPLERVRELVDQYRVSHTLDPRISSPPLSEDVIQEVASAADRPDLGPLLTARVQLLGAVVDLRDAVQATTIPAAAASSHIDLCPIFGVDIFGTNTFWDDDCLFILDVGGDDVYYNNAGGSNGLPGTSCSEAATALLLDFTGFDQYGDPNNPRSCGINGGGSPGSGHLLDFRGDDRYVAASRGVNGGGFQIGDGFLLDISGNDLYSARSYGVNGGAYSLSQGTLYDFLGNDRYEGEFSGVNGGGYFLSAGRLIDFRGTDAHYGEDVAVNGAAAEFARGRLWNFVGDRDVYVVNGGFAANGEGVFGLGLLVDILGHQDDYSDLSGGTGTDKTVLFKGFIGHQIDLQPI